MATLEELCTQIEECVACGVPSEKNFRSIALQLLCIIGQNGTGGGGGASADPSEVQVFSDENSGVQTPFLRRYSVDSGGVVTVVDTALDGTTVYAPTGVVGPLNLISTQSPIGVNCLSSGVGIRYEHSGLGSF